MKCRQFLLRYSDFRDGALSAGAAERCSAHLASCPTCRRYDAVVSRGTEVLRENPSAGPSEDFRARLQHSLYSLEEERRRRRIPRAGTGAVSFIAVAAVLTALVVTPLLRETEVFVDLPPIVVEAPKADGEPSVFATSNLDRAGPGPLEVQDLWTQSNALLYRYSSRYLRQREPSLVLTGLR